jgi:hypothetical protein
MLGRVDWPLPYAAVRRHSTTRSRARDLQVPNSAESAAKYELLSVGVDWIADLKARLGLKLVGD